MFEGLDPKLAVCPKSEQNLPALLQLAHIAAGGLCIKPCFNAHLIEAESNLCCLNLNLVSELLTLLSQKFAFNSTTPCAYGNSWYLM